MMSGDYRSKKEVAYLLVPAIGKKVVDLGGNLEKGAFFSEPLPSIRNINYILSMKRLRSN